MFPQVYRGLTLALLPAIPPILLLMWVVRGKFFSEKVGGLIVPWRSCDSDTNDENCSLGILDDGTPFNAPDSTWNLETALTKKTYGERRTGRVGVVLVGAGGYLALLSLRCFGTGTGWLIGNGDRFQTGSRPVSSTVSAQSMSHCE